MNKFTKGDLIWLREVALNVGDEHYLIRKSESFKSLVQKLQSMIDNYCNHEFSPCEGNYSISTCEKCGMVK